MGEIPEDSIFTLKCVEWYEALNWVAFQSFADPPRGPQIAFQFARDREDSRVVIEGFDRKEGRRELAALLILDKAENGKVRILGFHQDIPQDEDDDPEAPLQISEISRFPLFIPGDFFKRPYSSPDDSESSFANDTEAFHDPIVVVEDLWREFWGAPREPDSPDGDVRPHAALTVQANDSAASRSNLGERKRRGGGRPREYDWPGFAVEMMRQLRANALPDRRGECEAQMLLWCSENWPREPAASMVREWVAAFYNEFMADRATDRPPKINGDGGA
jgi:hypothetical protein